MESNNSDRKNLLLCLIGSGGSVKLKNEPIDGSLKLMKEAFLLKTELGERFGYNFVPYDFGPCSFQIYEDLKELTNEGIVKEDKNKVFSVYTISSSYENTVMELIENLKPEVREAIFKIKKEFNELTYYALISYVYQKYPQWTRASKFRLS